MNIIFSYITEIQINIIINHHENNVKIQDENINNATFLTYFSIFV